MDNCDQEMGSTPYSGTIQDLTFNLFSALSDQCLSANALFWITVWITAEDHGLKAKVQAHGSMVHGLWALGRGWFVGYLGKLLDLGWFSSRNVLRLLGCLRLGPRLGWRIGTNDDLDFHSRGKNKISCLITQVWSGVLKYHNATIGLNFNRMLW